MFTSIKDFAVAFKMECDRSKRTLAAVPDSGLAYKPHDKSRSAAEIAWHLVTAQKWFVVDNLKLSLKVELPKAAPKKTAEIVSNFEKLSSALLAAVEAKGDTWLKQTSDFLGRKLPNGAILATMLFHEIHHRGQLSVYLRLVGAKVPSIYGPSADEGMEAPPALAKGKKQKVAER